MKYILVFFLCFFQSLAYGQQFSKQELQDLEDEELLDLFNSYYNDTTIAAQIAGVYLKRAKQEKDTIKMARGYDRLSRIYSFDKSMKFADSIIKLTKDNQNITYPALGHIIKAYNHNTNDDLKQMINEYIIAYELAKKNNNITQQTWVLNRLISHKLIWGNKQEALSLQHKRHHLIMDEGYKDEIIRSTRSGSNLKISNLYNKDKIVSLINFSECFIRLNELDSARYYQRKISNLLNEMNMFHRRKYQLVLHQNRFITTYKSKEYKATISLIDSVYENYKDIITDADLFNIYNYKGFSEYHLGNRSEGLFKLLKADSISELVIDALQPIDRPLFVFLKRYYRNQENTEKEIYYLEKIIKLDSVFMEKFKIFDPSMVKKFETPSLIREKETLIAGLRNKNKNKATTLWVTLLLLAISICGGLYYFNRQMVYRKRYQAMISGKGQRTGVVNLSDISRQELSPAVIEEILMGMERFESRRCFLKADTNLKNMSDFCNTNTNYLSRVINLKLEKNFSKYIHDLRIDYAVNELLVKPIYRKYTIKAIANECGYTNAESFSRAFYKKNGIYPSYYIKKLEKEAM